MLRQILAKVAFIVTLVLALFITTLMPAMADGDPVATSVSTVQVVSIFVGTIIPILVALVTKSTWSTLTRQLVTITLAAISSFGLEYINSDNFVWQQALLGTVVTWIVAVASYLGLWQNKPVTKQAQVALTG